MHTFLALGDSYTIGEAVPATERWPVQLVRKLREKGIEIADPEIIATTGWTTGELIAAVDQQKPSENYDLVSLLAGVNNQYRGISVDVYRKEFEYLLKKAVGFAGGDAGGVMVISIPDYGVTPFGADKNPEKISLELTEYNRISMGICADYGVAWFDITPASRRAKDEPDLIAEDGLHPSGRMYGEWVETVFPYVVKRLINH